MFADTSPRATTTRSTRAVVAEQMPGLSSIEAERRLAQYGPNEAVPLRRASILLQAFRLFANPLVLILLVASAVSALLGQRSDAAIIVTMVVLGVAVNFWQSYRANAPQMPCTRWSRRLRPCSATESGRRFPFEASFRAT